MEDREIQDEGGKATSFGCFFENSFLFSSKVMAEKETKTTAAAAAATAVEEEEEK